MGLVEIAHERHHHEILRCVIIIMKNDSVERRPLEPSSRESLGLTHVSASFPIIPMIRHFNPSTLGHERLLI